MNKDQIERMFSFEVNRWFSDHGDQTLRVNYPLNQESLVVDLGGYEGKWAKTINDAYGCYVHVFEPVPQFCEKIKSLLGSNDRITIYQSALGPERSNSVINMSADSSSMFVDAANGLESIVPIAIESIHDFVNQFPSIDLLKINIEGAEYDLLDSLSEEELLGIENIQVQFHTFYPNCYERRNAIHNKLSKSHHLTYNYEFVWENWKNNQSSK